MPCETQNTSLLTHAQQIRILQRRIRVAEEGWRYSFDALNTLLTQIKTIDFTQEGAATAFQNRVTELFHNDLADAETDAETDEESGEEEENYDSMPELEEADGGENVDNLMRILDGCWLIP